MEAVDAAEARRVLQALALGMLLGWLLLKSVDRRPGKERMPGR